MLCCFGQGSPFLLAGSPVMRSFSRVATGEDAALSELTLTEIKREQSSICHSALRKKRSRLPHMKTRKGTHDFLNARCILRANSMPAAFAVNWSLQDRGNLLEVRKRGCGKPVAAFEGVQIHQRFGTLS